MQPDLLIRRSTLIDGRRDMDIAIKAGRIHAITPTLPEAELPDGLPRIDAAGYLVSPSFVDSHFHLDSALSLGRPRLNQSGTLLEGIALWNELKPDLTCEAIRQRALQACRQAIARGTLHIRSHVDICDDRLLAVQALLQVREEMSPWLDLQLVAFPQDGFLRDPQARANLLRALDLGVEVVGGIPHFERTQQQGAESVRELCGIAATRGLRVDMHCDESDDPLSRHVETLAFETQRLGLQGRVTGSHLTSMHSMDNYYVSKLLALLAEAELQVVANPLINLCLQGRHDTYPKRRGITRVPELLAAGINVAYGHDCVLDPWYSLGSHDMLDVAHMGLHACQMTSLDQLRDSYAMITDRGAAVMGLKDYGLAPGCQADLVILQARSLLDALRLRPPRLQVLRRGKVIASTAEAVPQLQLDGSAQPFDLTWQGIEFHNTERT